MKKLKVVTVVGTRPELIRLSRVIDCLEKNVNHKLIHTGQNFDYELNKIFFNDLSLRKSDYQIQSKSLTSIDSISKILSKVEKILIKENPDAFVVLGDTNSCLSAYCAKRLKIPIFHIEAGNRCYDERVPEEINRKIIDHISDINITYSKIAKENLLRENISPDKVFKIGSPLLEVYKHYENKILSSKILKKLRLNKNKYFLLSVHREENIEDDNNLKKLFNLLIYLNKKFKYKILFSTHPRTMKKIKKNNLKKLNNIIFHKPFSYVDYCNLQINSNCVLSDSGSITEESNIMGFKAINLRSTNERQEGFEFGAVPMAHFNLEIIDKVLSMKKIKQNLIDDYKCERFSDIFLNILLSYTNYINEYNWKKES